MLVFAKVGIIYSASAALNPPNETLVNWCG